LDVGLAGRSPEPLHLVRFSQEELLPFEFVPADPPFFGGRFEGGDHPVDILRVPGMDIDRDGRGGDARTVDGRLEVLADDHGDAGPDHRHPPGREVVLGIAEHVLQSLLPPEYELVVRERGGEHPEAVLLEEPGVLERTARRPVKDRHVDLEVPCGVKCGDDGTRPRLHVFHLVISRS
jgi:hypothetical protein